MVIFRQLKPSSGSGDFDLTEELAEGGSDSYLHQGEDFIGDIRKDIDSKVY